MTKAGRTRSVAADLTARDDPMNGKNPDVTRSLMAFIRARLTALKLSANKASVLAGLDRDAIRNIERGSMPAADKLNRLAPVLEVTASELLQFVPFGDRYAGPHQTENSVHTSSTLEHTRIPQFDNGPNDLRLMRQGGSVAGSVEDLFVSVIARPEVLTGRAQAYALYVPDNSNAPFLCAGQVVYIDPDRPIQTGRLVRLLFLNAAPMLGVLQECTDTDVVISVAADPAPQRFPRTSIRAIERIVAAVMLEL